MAFDPVACKQCGEQFTPGRRHQVFCSPKCRDAWWANHWKNEPHKCPQCGFFHEPPAEFKGMKEYITSNA